MSAMTIYDTATGAITRCTTVAEGEESSQCFPGEDWIAGSADPANERIDLATLQPVPVHEFSPVVTVNSIAGVPAGTAVYIPEADLCETCDDGVVTIMPQMGLPQYVDVWLTKPGWRTLLVSVPCA